MSNAAGLAIAINLAIAWTPLIIWVLFLSETEHIYNLDKTQYLLGVILFATMTMIYTNIVQLVLLAKGSKRYILRTVSLSLGVIFLPTIMLLIPLFLNNLYDSATNAAWLFTPFPWIGIEKSASTTVYLAMLSEFTVAVLLNFQLTRQLKVLGESSSKRWLIG